jgi:hypothetical protein
MNRRGATLSLSMTGAGASISGTRIYALHSSKTGKHYSQILHILVKVTTKNFTRFQQLGRPIEARIRDKIQRALGAYLRTFSVPALRSSNL